MWQHQQLSGCSRGKSLPHAHLYWVTHTPSTSHTLLTFIFRIIIHPLLPLMLTLIKDHPCCSCFNLIQHTTEVFNRSYKRNANIARNPFRHTGRTFWQKTQSILLLEEI